MKQTPVYREIQNMITVAFQGNSHWMWFGQLRRILKRNIEANLIIYNFIFLDIVKNQGKQ